MACDGKISLSAAASHQTENGSIARVSSMESEKAAYAFLPQIPIQSTDAHLVEFSEAMKTVAKTLRQVAEGKAAAQAEATEWKRKYELEKAVKAHKHHSVIKGCSNCVKDKLEHLASKLTLETSSVDQTGCCGNHGICSRQILQDQCPGSNQKSDDKIVVRKVTFGQGYPEKHVFSAMDICDHEVFLTLQFDAKINSYPVAPHLVLPDYL